MTNGTTPGKLKRLATTIAGSTTILMIGMFIAAEAIIKEVKPLRLFNHTGLTTINQNFLVAKLPPCMSAHENPQVLLLGSSLVLVPSVRCDDDFYKRKTRYDRWYYRNVIDEYTKADFFQNELARESGKQRNVLDLAVAASIMSDQYLILKKYLDSGKSPEMIVLGIAPRDFLDNLRQDPEKTPTYSILADLTCIKDLFEQKRSKESITNFALGYFSDVYKNRGDYKTFLTGYTARVTGHPVDLYNATKEMEKAAAATASVPTADLIAEPKNDSGVLDNSKPIYEARKNNLFDLKEYRRIYLPVNNQVFKTQMSYLDKFLALAQSHEIPVVLVEMPVTNENLALLPDDIKARFEKKVEMLATKYDAKVVKPLEKHRFTTEDFEDSVHLNGKGGTRVFSYVAEEIGKDRELAARSMKNKTTVGSLPIRWPFQ
ncbi:DUF1574 family protein [Candidatus Obscuribacterales bacterium]|nr:DUF1574 family protein [Candidatus Obscuribacterales bacterium]